jgi:23S rRNA (adenine2503-C2)-methyltransferase
MGLKRSLACFEIIGQIQLAHRFLEEHPAWLQRVGLPVGQRITNVVFMGMGEPMDNVPQVIKAIDIMIDPFGLALAPRRVTVSTAGHGDGLKLFMTSPLKVGLALSLHSPFSGERSKWMPINRRYPIEDIVELLTDYAHKRSLKFLVQYTVFKGQNDTPSHAQALVNLLKDRPVKVNLIPYNPIGPARFECPTGEDLQALQTALLRGGLRVMVRYSKGQDIAAACGQLVVEGDIHT